MLLNLRRLNAKRKYFNACLISSSPARFSQLQNEIPFPLIEKTVRWDYINGEIIIFLRKKFS